MADHTPGPWHIRLNPNTDESLRAFADENYQISGQPNAAPWIAETFGGLREGIAEANARLIARAPSMLALLEEIPLIIEELQIERAAPYADDGYTNGIDCALQIMAKFANKIQAEIDKAHGREVPLPDPELCPHGFGFVEYCEDCNQKEIKAKWREKEDSYG